MQSRIAEFSRKERSLNQDREDLRIRLEEEIRLLTIKLEDQRIKFEMEINRLLIGTGDATTKGLIQRHIARRVDRLVCRGCAYSLLGLEVVHDVIRCPECGSSQRLHEMSAEDAEVLRLPIDGQSLTAEVDRARLTLDQRAARADPREVP